jgi:hypothetical protein
MNRKNSRAWHRESIEDMNNGRADTVWSISDFDILDFGNEISMAGVLFHGQDRIIVAPFPGQLECTVFYSLPISHGMEGEDAVTLRMSAGEWERVLHQTDVLDTLGLNKAILRKSQRIIDQHIAWQVYERDDYRCRYCARRGPLTVDHIILWEHGGATVAENLLTACKKCNKTRGRTTYEEWVKSVHYLTSCINLASNVHVANLAIVAKLPSLREIKTKARSR